MELDSVPRMGKRPWSPILQVIRNAWSSFLGRIQNRFFKTQNPSPTRTFQIPHTPHLQKVFHILTSMSYEITEQEFSENSFRIEAVQESTASHLPDLSKVTPKVRIILGGYREAPGRAWQIRLSFAPNVEWIQGDLRYADLVLENLGQAFGWESFQVIECLPPKASAA